MDRQFLLTDLALPGAGLLDATLFTIGGVPFSLLSLLKLLGLLVLLFWGAGWMQAWIVRRALQRVPLDEGTRESVGSVVRYTVLAIGLTLILQNVGIQLGALGVVAGAFGVGIGFGLQNVISNFISGLIIMLERPIKVGDRVELANVEGTVREIGARRTTVLTHDNTAILVPNQRFILDNVVNLAYTQAPIRLRVPVEVAAGSDLREVEALLLEAARSQPEVLDAPAPQVLLLSLGGGTVTLELAVWHRPLEVTRQQLGSALNFAISDRLRAHAIRSS